LKTIAVDFDGTIAEYSGWKGKGVFGPPLDGAREGLLKLKYDGWVIIINTTRLEVDQISEYLKRNNLCYDYINFNPANVEQALHPAKVLADVYLDDRGFRFMGNWAETVENVIKNSKPWWRK